MNKVRFNGLKHAKRQPLNDNNKTPVDDTKALGEWKVTREN
jgi:hypothetical protein